MMPRDKIILVAEGVIVVYVLYQVVSTVYNHLKAKDRLKRKSIVIFLDLNWIIFNFFSYQIALQRQCRLIDYIVNPFFQNILENICSFSSFFLYFLYVNFNS
jgi:hypothetical protein